VDLGDSAIRKCSADVDYLFDSSGVISGPATLESREDLPGSGGISGQKARWEGCWGLGNVEVVKEYLKNLK
jgi:hypothetical protein